jgi:hypothetical protein
MRACSHSNPRFPPARIPTWKQPVFHLHFPRAANLGSPGLASRKLAPVQDRLPKGDGDYVSWITAGVSACRLHVQPGRCSQGSAMPGWSCTGRQHPDWWVRRLAGINHMAALGCHDDLGGFHSVLGCNQRTFPVLICIVFACARHASGCESASRGRRVCAIWD